MNTQNLGHILGALVVIASLAVVGWAPHNATYGVLGMFVGAATLLSSSQLAIVEKILGKLPVNTTALSLGSSSSPSTAATSPKLSGNSTSLVSNGP